MYVQEEGLCLALGLPMISFYARPHSTIGADVFLQVGTAGGRVERGGMSRAAWERGSFDPLLLGWRRRVLTAPLQLGWQASFPGLCLDGCRGALVFPEPAKGKTKFGARVEVQVQVSSGAANRIESDRGGSDRTEGTLS